MDYYVVGDINGMADLARQVADLVYSTLRLEPESHVIFLGNYIDNGGREYETLKLLSKLKFDFPNRCHFLAGRHELLMLNTLYYANRNNTAFNNYFYCWWQNNAFTTLWSTPTGLISWDFPQFIDSINEFLPFFEQFVGGIDIKINKGSTHESFMGYEITHMPRFIPESASGKSNDFEDKVIQVYGHSITSENAIKTQINNSMRPLGAGSFISRKLAFASLIKPDVKILKTDEYSAYFNEQYNWLKDSKEKYIQTRNLLQEGGTYRLENPNTISAKTETLFIPDSTLKNAILEKNLIF